MEKKLFLGVFAQGGKDPIEIVQMTPEEAGRACAFNFLGTVCAKTAFAPVDCKVNPDGTCSGGNGPKLIAPEEPIVYK